MPDQNRTSRIIIIADRIIDGLGGEVDKGSALVLEDGSIRGVMPKGEARATDQAQVIEFPGASVVPGLIDCHTHTNMPGNSRRGEDVNAEDDDELRLYRSFRNVRIALETGVTTLCDNGAWNDLGFRLKAAIEEGKVVGADVLACGNPITIRKGHCWFMGSEVSGPEEARAKAGQHLAAGADFLKAMTTGGSTLGSEPYAAAFQLEELQAITGAAREAGVYTVGHARCSAGINMAVDAGFSMIAHCVFAAPDQSYCFDEAVAEKLVENGVWNNPTLAIWESRLRLLKEKAEGQELTEEEKQEVAKGERAVQERVDECGRLKEMGGKFVAGSDCGWGAYPFGYFVREIEALARAGLTNMEALMSGTSEAARALNIIDRVGSLEAGKQADILVVDGDPLADLSTLTDVAAVFKRGQLVERRLTV